MQYNIQYIVGNAFKNELVDKPDHHSSFFLPLDFLLKYFEFVFSYQKYSNRNGVTTC